MTVNLNHIISKDEDTHREFLIERVRHRQTLDTIKLEIFLAVIEQFHGANPDLAEALTALNHHINRFIKPVHGAMMSEPLTNSTRSKPKRRHAVDMLTPKN